VCKFICILFNDTDFPNSRGLHVFVGTKNMISKKLLPFLHLPGSYVNGVIVAPNPKLLTMFIQ
jgi:hypothetical protein